MRIDQQTKPGSAAFRARLLDNWNPTANPLKAHFLGLVIVLSALAGAAQAQSLYEPYSIATMAGLALNAGTNDNTGSFARFNEPWGVAVDGTGNVYVADTMNHTVRKIIPGGIVTTLAGIAAAAGFNNGAAGAAQFDRPTGVAVDGAGIVYVADYNNHIIRRIAGGVVSTLAGFVGVFGTNDAIGTSARFHNPFGVAVNNAGTVVYVADQNNQTIRRITVPEGVVTTLAGAAGVNGSTDGANNVARFNTPRGIAVDGGANVYVADAGNLTVRKILSSGGVSTMAGSVFTPGFNDGLGTNALFSRLQAMSPWGGPCGVAVDGAGNIYVTDQGNHTLRKITPGGSVTTLAGSALTSGSADGTGIAACFTYPGGVAVDSVGVLYVADTSNSTLRVSVNTNCDSFVNGDFRASVPANGTGGGWTSSGILVAGSDGWGATNGNPGGGFRLNEIGNYGYNPTLKQTVCCLIPGNCYTIHWQMKVHVYQNNPDRLPSFGVLLNGNIIAQLNLGPNDTVWHDFAVDFVATNTCQTIGFSAELDPTDVSYDLDNVWLDSHPLDKDCGCLQILCPNDITAYGCTSAIVDFVVSATNSCDTNEVIVLCTPPTHSAFLLGTTVVNCTAQDAAGHLVWCSFAVTVLPDTSPPVITPPADKTISCTNDFVFDLPTVVSACCGTDYSISIFGNDVTALLAPCIYAITRTWLIVDCNSNTNFCSQTVTVANTNAPFILCPKDIVVNSCGVTQLFYSVTAMDACNTNLAVVCTPPSGSDFAPGTTNTVLCVASNCMGSASCRFTIIVRCPSNSCTAAPANLVLWLPFDETGGTNSANLVPVGHAGTQVGAPGVVNGFVGNSLGFNGSNQYVSVPDYAAINPGTNALSIDAWIRRDLNSATVPRIVVDKRNQTTGIGYSLAISYGNLLFQLCDGAYNYTNYRDSGIVPADDQWHFVAVTVNRGLTNGGRFYVDAILTGTFDPTDHPGSLNNADALVVGNAPFGGALMWMGGIDEVEVFDRALGADEIAAIFNAGASGKCKNYCDTPLVVNCPTNKTVDCGAKWKFDQPSATGTFVTITSAGVVTDGGCPQRLTQSWLITDACGNSQTCIQTVTFLDTEPPAMTCPTDVLIVALDANCQLEIPTIRPPASDNCTPVSELVYTQNPPAGTVLPGPCQLVTVTVRDACENIYSCQIRVCGRDKTPPTVIYPKAAAATNCVVPDVLGMVSAFDNCTASNQLAFSQSPSAGTAIAAGGNLVTVTVTDQAGNSTTHVIPLISSGVQSFLPVLFNTGVNSNKTVLADGSVDPHYSLGPVPAGIPTGPGYYNAPHAVVGTSFLGLPPHTASKWISPSGNYHLYPDGLYTYTNQFILPAWADPLTASISGRWTADTGAEMYFNGSWMPAASLAVPGLGSYWPWWKPFTINSGFLAFPAVNQLLLVVQSTENITALRVEITNAAVNCSTCTPPVIGHKTPNQSLPLNSTAVFSVSVGGTPPLAMQWFHNSLPLTNGGHYSGVTTPSLTVTPVSYADAGTYYVVVSNPCGEIRSVPAKLTITHGWPWWWAWWNFARLDNPMKATVGPDLVVTGIHHYGISAGTTRDFDLPNRGGQIANVLYVPSLASDILIKLPLPGGSNAVSSFTLIMDVYAPNSPDTPATFFDVFFDIATGVSLAGDRISLSRTPGVAGAELRVSGTVGGMPVNLVSPVPLLPGMWNRVALAVRNSAVDLNTDAEDLFLYLNGKPVGSASFSIPAGAVTIGSNSLATVCSSPEGTAGEVYVACIQFHAFAMPPEMIAGVGSPRNGGLFASQSSVGMPTVLSITPWAGGVNLSWQGSVFLLLETSDLTTGVWMNSMLPFDQIERDGEIINTGHENPPLRNSAGFYRLIYAP